MLNSLVLCGHVCAGKAQSSTSTDCPSGCRDFGLLSFGEEAEEDEEETVAVSKVCVCVRVCVRACVRAHICLHSCVYMCACAH